MSAIYLKCYFVGVLVGAEKLTVSYCMPVHACHCSFCKGFLDKKPFKFNSNVKNEFVRILNL